MMADKYPIATLLDIAAIPEEAFPRFMAELPDIVAATRRYISVQNEVNAEFGLPIMQFAVPEWIDDDKGELRVKVSDSTGATLAEGVSRLAGEA